MVEKSVRIYMPEIAMCPNVQPSITHCYTHYLARVFVMLAILFTDAHWNKSRGCLELFILAFTDVATV